MSGEGVYDFGWAELTSITAYRYNKYSRGGDFDFNDLDILYRDDDGGSYNRFKTFSQELRLQGNAFGNHLDWLVGGYYANEKLQVADNISYGADYDRYANCLVADNFAFLTGQAGLLTPGSATCFNKTIASALLPAVGANAPALAAFAGVPIIIPGVGLVNFGAPPFGNNGFTNVATFLGHPGLSLANTGLNDLYNQTSNNWAVFTHNIVSITDQLKLTVGARYTHERKTLSADLTDNMGLCNIISASPFAALQQPACVLASIPGAASESTTSGRRTNSRAPRC